MKILLKLTDSGLALGTSEWITLVNSRDNPTLATVQDPGYDFAISTDSYIDIGTIKFSYITGNTPSHDKLVLNLPLLGYYDGSNLQLPSLNFTWANNRWSNNFIDTENTVHIKTFGDLLYHTNVHVYLWRSQGRTYWYATPSGLGSLPNPIKEALKISTYLYRFTLNWPESNRRSLLSSPGNTKATFINQSDPAWSIAGGVYILAFYASWPVRCILEGTQNNSNGPKYYSHMSGLSLSGAAVREESNYSWSVNTYPAGVPAASKPHLYIVPRICLWDPKQTTRQLWTDYPTPINSLQSTITFEGRDRDIAISPVLFTESGDLDLVQMDSKLNASAMSTGKFISLSILGSDELIPQDSSFDDKYVKI